MLSWKWSKDPNDQFFHKSDPNDHSDDENGSNDSNDQYDYCDRKMIIAIMKTIEMI